MNYEMLDRLTAAHCQLRESAKEIESMAMDCYPGASALDKCKKERIRQQERANKYAVALNDLTVAAQAVCERWDSHSGASDEHIEKLRKAIEDANK